MINRETVIDENDWYYVVRIDSNERFYNSLGDVNICNSRHIDRLVNKLNRWYDEPLWEGISIADYNMKFGKYMN